MADVLIRRAEKALLPGLSSAIEVKEIGTSLTNVRYTGHHRGAIYFPGQMPMEIVIRGLDAAPSFQSPASTSVERDRPRRHRPVGQAQFRLRLRSGAGAAPPMSRSWLADFPLPGAQRERKSSPHGFLKTRTG